MKQVASLRYGVIFKKAFCDPEVFKGFVRDILGIQIETETFADEVVDKPSKNHSLIMGRITGLLFNDERLIVMPELSLDTSQIDLNQFNLKAKDELIPDVCV
jgi:hypothetical protein